MWNFKIYFSLLLFTILTLNKTEANSTACEQKEKHLAILDLAKESISKVKDLHPSCVNDDKDNSLNTTECGVKEKVSAYLDIAMNLIEGAKENFTTCDVTRNVTKIELRKIELHKKPIDCSEILENGANKSGIYTIWPRHRIIGGKPLKVYCDMETDGGGWTVIQRRGPFRIKINFNRTWNEYKHGFGNLSEEFWIGNDNIFALTNQGNYSTRFDIWKVNEQHFYAIYSSFWIEDESAGYMLHFGNYVGSAGDGIKTIKDAKFSTKDKRNDKYKTPCTSEKQGGWWYSDCGLSNPNGINIPEGKNDWKYMNWSPLTNYDSLLGIEIKIRSEN